MRVAIDARKIDDFGIGSYIRGLVGALCRHRPDWEFLMLGTPDRDGRWPANVSWLPERAAKYGLRELWSLSSRVRRLGADLFHTPHYVYPFGLPCPGIVTIHDCIHLRYPAQLPRAFGVLPRGASRSYARWMMARASRAARRVLTVSEATASDLTRMLGVPRDRITVIPNGCDLLFLEQVGAAASEPASPSWPEPYLLFVGNAKPHKNVERLLLAFARVASTRPGIQLVLAGAFSRQVQSQAAGLPRTHVVGKVSDDSLRRLYRGATALCQPSLYEGFGLPALEAMASGTAVVAARTGGLPEVVGDAALLVDPYDIEDIAGALGRVCDDERLRRDLAERGRVRAATFTWERAAAATATEYRRATGLETT